MPPTGTTVHCTPKTQRKERSGCNTPWPLAASCTHQRVSHGGGPDFSLPLGTQTPTFPPSSSAGAKTGSQELGEVMMHPCSSWGKPHYFKHKLLAIHLAGEDFPDFLAGRWGEGVGVGSPQARLCSDVLLGQSPMSVTGAERQQTGDKPSALYSWMSAVPGYLGQPLWQRERGWRGSRMFSNFRFN